MLTTIVQSGATLVAIIAGLLVARLVAIVGERNTLQRRIKELSEVRDQKAADFDAARLQIVSERADTFIDHIFKDYVKAPDNYTFEDLYAADEPGASMDELRPYFENFAERVNRVLAEPALANLPEDEPSDWNKGGRDRVLAQFPDPYEQEIAGVIVAEVQRKWAERRRQHQSFGGFLDRVAVLPPLRSAEITAARMQMDAARWREMLKGEADAKTALEAVELELQHTERALLATAKPEGLILAMSVLAVIAVAGIVIPLMPIALGSTNLSITSRAAYTGLFILSLVVFFLYLGWEMRRITKASNGSSA